MERKIIPSPYLIISFSTLVFVLYLMPFFNRGLVRILYPHLGYYLTFALVTAWIAVIIQCLRHYRPDIKSFIKSYGYGLLFSVIVCAIISASVKPQFRVLSDETNLLSISKSMLYERKADNVTMGTWYYNNFHPITRAIDKRPLLLPFFTYIIHVLRGYHVENVFILNIFVLFILLFLIYAQVKNYLGSDIWALSAVILVASQPIVSETAASAGFDMLAALFLVICFSCLRWFLNKPETVRFQLLWVSLLMLANIRYEGIVVLMIVLFSLACLRYFRSVFFTTGLSLVYPFTPLALLNIYWIKFLMKDHFETKGKIPFSLDYCVNNHAAFFKSIFDFSFFLPYASVISILGLFGLAYFVYLFFIKRSPKEAPQRHLILISFACILADWAIIMLYFESWPANPSSSRFFLPFFILLSLFVVILANGSELFRRNPAYVLLFSVTMFLLYNPVAVKDTFFQTSILPREYIFVTDFLKREYKDSKDLLIIANRSGHYTVWNYGAVGFAYANTSGSIASQYKNHLYNNIIVIQDIKYNGLQPKDEDRLSDKFVLEKIFEIQNKQDCLTRISRVTSVLPDKKQAN